MENLEVLIEKCEKTKSQIILLSKKDKRSYDVDLFPRSLRDFLNNIIRCMKHTPSIPSGNRFNNWWRLFWDRCTIDTNITNWARGKFSDFVYSNVKQETTTWKLKYLILTIVYFTKNDISSASQYLRVLIARMRDATEYPIQLTYYQVILALFDVHRAANDDYLLNIMKQTLGDISDVEIIDPILHLTDTDQYCRTVLNSINRKARPSVIIYSILCAEANLLYKKLLPPLKNSKIWIDFNLNAETITLICQRSCLRSERPSTDSEEFDDCTTEILTISFVNIDKISVKIWGHKQSLQGKLLSILLNKSPSYIYESSRAAVEQANKLLLNIEEGDELNRLLEILSDVFTTRFERLRKNFERQGSHLNINQSGQSNLSLTPYSGRSVSISSMTSLENSNLEEDISPQLSVARKEMLSLRRSGSTIQSIRQIQTTIHTYVNPDIWPPSNSRMLSNQNPNKSRLSLTTDNDDEDDSVIESSQENKPSTLNTLQAKIAKTMDKYYPKPYKSQVSTTTLDSMYKERFDCSSYKENQPVNTSQHRPSSATDVLSTAVNSPKLSQNQPVLVTDVINLPSHSDSEQAGLINKSSGNEPSQVNDRLKDILVQSDYDDESVISDISDKSIIISGSLRNRANIGRSLFKTLNHDSQDSAKNFPVNLTPNRNSSTISSKCVQELVSKTISQSSQETLSSGVEFQPRTPNIIFGKRYDASSECHPENVATREKILSQKTPIDLSQKSHGSNSSSIDFQQRVVKRNNRNWFRQNTSTNRKSKLNKSLNLSHNKSSERFEKNNLNDSVTILDTALGNPQLPKKFKPTILNNSNHEPALQSSSQCNILLSSQTSRTPTAISKKPLHQQSLSVETPDTTLTNEIRDMLRSSLHSYLPQTPTFITPISEVSSQSALSRVSVSPSTCESTPFDTDRSDYPSEDDEEGKLVIDLGNEPVNLSDEHDTDEIISAPVPVQPIVRRKRGRPNKPSEACVLNTDDANDSANTTAQTNKSKRTKKKSQNKCDCLDDATDKLNCTSELPAVRNKAEEKEQKRIRRYTTKTRDTKPPIRLTDELNKSYLESVKGKIRRKRESGYLTDTVVYQKKPSQRPRRADTTMERLNQTLDANSTDYRYGADFESVDIERGTLSDVESGEKHRKKHKKSKRIRTEYDSSLIDMDERIRMRLSRRNSTCDLLTQDPLSQGETQQSSESQESQGWGAVFKKRPVQRKASADLSNAEKIRKSENYVSLKNLFINNGKLGTDMDNIRTYDDLEQEMFVHLIYVGSDLCMSSEQIKGKLKQDYGKFFHDD